MEDVDTPRNMKLFFLLLLRLLAFLSAFVGGFERQSGIQLMHVRVIPTLEPFIVSYTFPGTKVSLAIGHTSYLRIGGPFDATDTSIDEIRTCPWKEIGTPTYPGIVHLPKQASRGSLAMEERVYSFLAESRDKIATTSSRKKKCCYFIARLSRGRKTTYYLITRHSTGTKITYYFSASQ